MFLKLLFSKKPSFLAVLSQRRNQRDSFKSWHQGCIFSRNIPLLLLDPLYPGVKHNPINKCEWMQACNCILQTQTLLPGNVIAWAAKMKGSPPEEVCKSSESAVVAKKHTAPWSAIMQMFIQTDGAGELFIQPATLASWVRQQYLELCEKLENHSDYPTCWTRTLPNCTQHLHSTW